jgi:predicted ATP-grasp superfamily ATP-dependent carboligase
MRVSTGATPAVLLGGAVNALSVARSLWRAGVQVDLLSDGRGDSIARYSRACRSHIGANDHEPVGERWMTWLRERSAPAVLLPCSDEGIEFIATRRGELEAAGHTPIEADDQASLCMLDKARAYGVAREAGVPAPRTAAVTSLAELDGLDFSFPCGVKPLNSHLFARHFDTAAKGARVADLDHARRMLGPILQAGYPMLLTEVVPGGDDQYRSYYSFIDERGEPLLNFTKRKLRQFPTHFGLGTYHLTEWNEEVAGLGLRFARAAGLRGVVNVEFKRDERDGRLKLIECNPRFTEVNEQVRAAGIDLALVAYNRAVGQPLPPIDSFREHLAIWFPVNDLRALREYRQHRELTTAAWLRTLLYRQAPLMFSWRDPRPSAVMWTRRASSLARRALHGEERAAVQAAERRRDPYLASDAGV